MEQSQEDQLVEDGQYFAVFIGPPCSPAWEGIPKVFKVINKEFGVVTEETVSEMSARYYKDHHEKVKTTYRTQGLAALLGEAEGPEERHG